MLAPYIVDGKTFNLSHLNTFTRKTSFKLRSGEKTAPVEVTFSCHCWSRSPLQGEQIPATHFVHDGSEQMPRHRLFCPSRHELSLELPGLIDKMLTNRALVYYTAYRNVVRLEDLAPVVAGTPPTKYYIFIKLTKRAPEGAQKFIKMVVESAYPDSVMYDNPSYGKPIAFSELLGDCWEGRYPKA